LYLGYNEISDLFPLALLVDYSVSSVDSEDFRGLVDESDVEEDGEALVTPRNHNSKKTPNSSPSRPKKYPLKILDLQHNFIENFTELENLSDLPRLTELNIVGNPLVDRYYEEIERENGGGSVDSTKTDPAIPLIKSIKRALPNLTKINAANVKDVVDNLEESDGRSLSRKAHKTTATTSNTIVPPWLESYYNYIYTGSAATGMASLAVENTRSVGLNTDQYPYQINLINWSTRKYIIQDFFSQAMMNQNFELGNTKSYSPLKISMSMKFADSSAGTPHVNAAGASSSSSASEITPSTRPHTAATYSARSSSHYSHSSMPSARSNKSGSMPSATSTTNNDNGASDLTHGVESSSLAGPLAAIRQRKKNQKTYEGSTNDFAMEQDTMSNNRTPVKEKKSLIDTVLLSGPIHQKNTESDRVTCMPFDCMTDLLEGLEKVLNNESSGDGTPVANKSVNTETASTTNGKNTTDSAAANTSSSAISSSTASTTASNVNDTTIYNKYRDYDIGVSVSMDEKLGVVNEDEVLKFSPIVNSGSKSRSPFKVFVPGDDSISSDEEDSADEDDRVEVDKSIPIRKSPEKFKHKDTMKVDKNAIDKMTSSQQMFFKLYKEKGKSTANKSSKERHRRVSDESIHGEHSGNGRSSNSSSRDTAASFYTTAATSNSSKEKKSTTRRAMRNEEPQDDLDRFAESRSEKRRSSRGSVQKSSQADVAESLLFTASSQTAPLGSQQTGQRKLAPLKTTRTSTTS